MFKSGGAEYQWPNWFNFEGVYGSSDITFNHSGAVPDNHGRSARYDSVAAIASGTILSDPPWLHRGNGSRIYQRGPYSNPVVLNDSCSTSADLMV